MHITYTHAKWIPLKNSFSPHIRIQMSSQWLNIRFCFFFFSKYIVRFFYMKILCNRSLLHKFSIRKIVLPYSELKCKCFCLIYTISIHYSWIEIKEKERKKTVCIHTWNVKNKNFVKVQPVNVKVIVVKWYAERKNEKSPQKKKTRFRPLFVLVCRYHLQRPW